MSDFDKSNFTDFGKLVPGFDFLQNLTRQATASAGQGQPKMPQLGHWIAPTMSVEELEKRIAELKAVQFWLDQNATALKATIQALEVQKMTLATLHGMNVNMAEMAKAFSVKMPDVTAAEPDEALAPEPVERPGDAAASAPGGVDPMQWWGALTQQFQSIAASALKEAADRQPLAASQGMAPEKAKPATKTAAKAAVKAPVKAKAKAKASAPASRKTPTRTR
ncbi:MAG: hypothetical protein HQ445_08985 [Polaromonas sp.]|nr:hypothetical protein [Polaromonas sp.]